MADRISKGDMPRRRVLWLAASTAAVSILSACGGGSNATDTPKPSVGASSASAAASAPTGTTGTTVPTSAPGGSTTAATGDNPFGAAGKKGGVYTFSIGSDDGIRILIPTSYYGTTQFIISKVLYTPLVTLDRNWQNLGPAIASKWDWSPDNKQLTMSLRKDIKFHDGSLLTARDVEFTYKLMVRSDAFPAFQDVTAFVGGDEYKKGTTETFGGVTVIDDATVRFNLSAPSSVFLLNLSNVGILPAKGFGPDALASGADIAKLAFFTGGKPIGTGPFKVKAFDIKTNLTLEANRDYYKGAPNLDGITFRFGLAVPAQVAALQSGEIDGVMVAPKDATALRDQTNLALLTNYAMANETVLITATEKPYLNTNVRQGLLTAIDRSTLAKTVGYGFPKDAPSVMMHASLFPNPSLPSFPFSVDKAKALLKDGGWDASRKLKLGRWVAQGTPTDIDAAIMTMWKAVGVDAEYLPMDPANQTKISQETPHQYDVAITSFAWLAYNPATAYSSFACERKPDYSNFCNPDFDSAMKQAMSTLDAKASADLYRKAQNILGTELPYAPVWMDPEIFAVNKKVHGGVFGRGPLNDVQSELWWKE